MGTSHRMGWIPRVCMYIERRASTHTCARTPTHPNHPSPSPHLIVVHDVEDLVCMLVAELEPHELFGDIVEEELELVDVQLTYG